MRVAWPKFFLLVGILTIYLFLYRQGYFSEFNLAWLKAQYSNLTEYYHANPVLMLLQYCLVYFFVVALSIPGATLLTLGGAAVFGFWKTLIMVSFVSTAGSALAFLLSRYLFRNVVEKTFGRFFVSINKGIEENGISYLFALRLMALIPFFVLNLVMGLTQMPLWSFVWVSQLGMLPGTALYVYAGTTLSKITSLQDIFSAPIAASFLALALVPWFIKKIFRRLGLPKTSDV
jgi:uncharacterized membrane protein YdjX (TVP38/TMEM64 family)